MINHSKFTVNNCKLRVINHTFKQAQPVTVSVQEALIKSENLSCCSFGYYII